MPIAARPIAVIALAIAIAIAIAGPARAADLALKRVTLSSAGVGYFEYAADVDGAVALGLDVPLDAVDDVLKSLVVLDSAGGVGGLELPGRDQTHAVFGDVPFGPDALGSPLQFLNSLQGVEVTVQGPRPMTGRIRQAEQVHETMAGPNGAPRPTDRTRVRVLGIGHLHRVRLFQHELAQSLARPSACANASTTRSRRCGTKAARMPVASPSGQPAPATAQFASGTSR